MTDIPLDPARCPLCGEANACAMAAGSAAECWCASLRIAAEVIDRIPARARGLACVCARCAGGAAPDERRDDA